MRRTLRRVGVLAAASAALVLAIAVPASAHVTVNPKEATQGGYAKLTFRVPNEMAGANTVKLEINLPEDSPIASVSIKPVAGWTATATKTKLANPVTNEGRTITDAVTVIVWTADAGGIKPGEFQEFDVSAGPLPAKDQIIFKALQTYSDGTIVRWIDLPKEGSEPAHPAPVLKLVKAGAPSVAAPSPSSEGSPAGIWLGATGLVLGLAGLVVGLLAYRKATNPT